MIRSVTENPMALGALILAQGACAGIFLFDVVLDGGELQGLWPIDWHFAVEAAAVAGLIAGIAFEIRVLLRLLARKAHLEHQVSMAASALHDVIEAHFRDWSLTASEVDVAWFTVKGLSIAEIARLRGSAEGTVKSHLNAIYRKAGVANRGELLSLLIEDLMAGPVPPPAPTAAA
ncbi:helix-turn-helix transcriptional regulator [Rhodobacterales bacterium HKCCSP123]|nr:helix-turn-helix transcriptional regulator [Rhodobacterales bacterium HKCCSP123]